MQDYAARVPQGETRYTEAEAVQSCKSAYSQPPRDPAKNLSATPKRPTTPAPSKPPTVAEGGAAAELKTYMDRVVSGEIVNAPWPFQMLTTLTQALLPGSVVNVCGDPGVGKTFLILQCLQYWHGNGLDPVVFFIEKDRRFHTMRLLAQLEGDSRFVDFDWIKANGAAVDAAMGRNAAFIDEIGKCIYSEPLERVTLESLGAWIRQVASAGKRIIVIDPVTAASAGDRRWIEDENFMLDAQRIVSSHGCTLINVTHPKLGQAGKSSLSGGAGGAAWSRFCDTYIWINKPKQPRRVQIMTSMGPSSGRFGLFFQLHKTRDGRGAGKEIAYTFGQGLKYAEQGLVLRELPESPEQSQEAS